MDKLYINTRYGVAPNRLLNRKDLSLKAKGLYTYMQAKPDGWDFSSERIALEHSDGRDAVRSALQELEEKGYLTREKQRTPDGQWSIEYRLFEAGTGYPAPDKPTSEKPSTKKAIPENNSNKNFSKKNSPPVAVVDEVDDEEVVYESCDEDGHTTPRNSFGRRKDGKEDPKPAKKPRKNEVATTLQMDCLRIIKNETGVMPTRNMKSYMAIVHAMQYLNEKEIKEMVTFSAETGEAELKNLSLNAILSDNEINKYKVQNR